MYRFLLTPRWLGRIALALVGAVAFVALGVWQFGRARTVVAPVPAAAAGALARPLATVLAGARTVTATTAGQLVTATGTWDRAGQAVVPDRSVGGRDGRWVVTPLRRSTGPALLVVRGFVPNGSTAPVPPAGPVTVTGWLAGSEPGDGTRTSGPGQVDAVSGALFVNRVAYPLVDGYLGATRVVPADRTGLTPVPLPGGGLTVRWSWQSLGYAVQWNLFALGAFVVLIIAARQHAREQRAHQLAQAGRAEVSF